MNRCSRIQDCLCQVRIISLQKYVRNLNMTKVMDDMPYFPKNAIQITPNIIHLDKGRSLCSDYIWGSDLDKWWLFYRSKALLRHYNLIYKFKTNLKAAKSNQEYLEWSFQREHALLADDAGRTKRWGLLANTGASNQLNNMKAIILLHTCYSSFWLAYL